MTSSGPGSGGASSNDAAAGVRRCGEKFTDQRWEEITTQADQDPAQWLPPAADARCRWAAEWVSTKLRWSLAADDAEVAALRVLADACPQQTAEYEPVP
jgi:hypothetical protein